MSYSIFFYFYLFCSMQKKKRYTLHDALEAIVGDDSEFEGCDDSSDEDPDHPLYNRNSQDRERDESSECGDLDRSESSTSNDVPQPKREFREAKYIHPRNKARNCPWR